MESENKKDKNFELIEVPTGSALAIKSPEEEVLTLEQLLVRMANDLKEIKVLLK